MCTAVSFCSGEHYFGRNLDLECSLGEQVTVMPRQYPIDFCRTGRMIRHYAMIGMALVKEDVPLFYDAMNEHGLAMAGLNFPGNAVYGPDVPGQDNLPAFALIPWVLSQCDTVAGARKILQRVHVTDEPFSDYPVTPLHWILSDKAESIAVEQTENGMQLHDNPVRVLTNNPPFPWQMTHLAQFLSLTAQEPGNRFDSDLPLIPFSRGMGAIGLPGDFSSPSRFVRAAFALRNSRCGDQEEACVNQLLHLLNIVSMPRGSVMLKDQKPETTVYSCCCSSRGMYYYTTYENSRVTAVDMHQVNLDGEKLITFPLRKAPDFFREHAVRQ